jgi:hypothetical protein
MRKKITTLLFIMLGLASSKAQEKTENAHAKTGWNFGALPAITYNTDLGFQYGGLINLFHYGDGSQFPDYRHNIYFEISRFTKGSGIYRLAYDSKYLIPGIRITSDLAYLPDMAFDFFGFNGYQAVYNTNWTNDELIGQGYKSRMFYKMQNNTFRFKTDIQFPLGDKNLLALVGFNLQNYTIQNVDIDKMNDGKEASDPKYLPNVPTLYNEYISWGLIPEEEKNGGFVPLLKAGLVYDTRDNEPNPMKGIWTEAFIFGAPELLGSQSSFMKLNITHRQYFTIIQRDLSFAYRLSYQGTLAGDVPFYYQTQIETSQMKDQIGLGGTKTLRGVIRNRVVGDGFVYGNAELRWKAVHFNFINQRFYIGINGFFDAGQVVQFVDVESKIRHRSDITQADYFDFDGGEKLHMSYGLGMRIVMNQNFIIAVDHGRAVNKQDGKSGTYIGLNYLF